LQNARFIIVQPKISLFKQALRPQRIKSLKGKCTDEQADHTLSVRVDLEPAKLKDTALL
jgi:hypothetical protein